MAQTRLEQLAAMSKEQLIAALASAETKTRKEQTITFRVAEKGGVSAYGTGRFPVTQYAETWVKLLVAATGFGVNDLVDTPLLQFIRANAGNGLSFKRGIPELEIEATVNAR